MKKNCCRSEVFAGLVFSLFFLSCAVQAQANLKEMKAYKEAFPDAKAKCATCHIQAMPKKENAELNDYGKAAIAANPSPTAETFKQLGKIEDFSSK
ncbi:MAG: hypothetical protein WC552_10200 [Candidatus Omnitrophota bacterium]